jgi:hypothetical protein
VSTDFHDHVGVRLQPIDPVEEVVKMAAGSRKSPLPRSAEP